MRFWDLIRIANRNLFRNKLRTFLTVAAIFVGSFTLTMTNGVGDGMRSYVDTQVKNIEGDAVLFVRRKIETGDDKASKDEVPEYKDEAEGTKPPNRFDPTSLLVTREQMQDALAGIPQVKTITPHYPLSAEYLTVDDQKKYLVDLSMISEGLTQKTELGTTISKANQIVIPLDLAKTLSATPQDLIGKKATVAYKGFDHQMRTISLDIVGVATKGFRTNRSSFVDPQTAEAIYTAEIDPAKSGKFGSFSVQLSSSDPDKIQAVKSRLVEKGFTAESMADQEKRTYDAIGIFKVVMSLVAFIALLAASFGIINTLVIAVLERTKEIGLQKALGMGRGKIFLIFSLESVLIGLWGAVLGIVAAIVIGLIANQVLIKAYGKSFEGYTLFVFTVPSIVLVTLIVCTIAFLAGVLPAIRASRLNPIESLRYE